MTVQGFFFLRFISPAVVSPEAFGLIDGKRSDPSLHSSWCRSTLPNETRLPEQVSAKCRRGLVLISKVIQNLANGILFGEKEVRSEVQSMRCSDSPQTPFCVTMAGPHVPAESVHSGQPHPIRGLL